MLKQPFIAVDCVPFRYVQGQGLMVGCVRRTSEPALRSLALPGVAVLDGERLNDSVRRCMSAKAGSDRWSVVSQFAVFDSPNRDPRSSNISIAYMTVSENDSLEWFSLTDVPELAFDHNEIVQSAIEYVGSLFMSHPGQHVTRSLLPSPFSTQMVREIVEQLGIDVSIPNLARLIERYPGVQSVEGVQSMGRGKPARLWNFSEK